MLVAITRAVSPSLADCELTHLDREPIDLDRAIAQHAAYEALLRALAVEVVRAPAAPEHPDAVFVEDTALVLKEVAVLTRPGAESRRGELSGIARILGEYRDLLTLASPATLDGGDVLVLGRTIYVGRSARTNTAGIASLSQLLAGFDYQVVAVDFNGCLHLKSAVTQVADRLLLINPAWVAALKFPGYDTLAIDPREPPAANGLMVGDALVYPADFPATAAKLAKLGLKLNTLDYGELAKAEGAVTCCSLLFSRSPS